MDSLVVAIKGAMMEEMRVVEVKRDILAGNDEKADAFRAMLAERSTFFADIMASPGAGKTTLLLALIKKLRERGCELDAWGSSKRTWKAW